ncbi:hypothetical protein [Fusobacterium sp. MFO224]|uniref:hypothetical protein n=1 Tax=Fusobacterium sp. MFO224 TaxID=3378070 RepID=UPI003853A3ED
MKKIFNVVAVFLLVFLIAIFGLKDTIIKNTIEKEMTKGLGVNVKVYGVDYSVFKNFLELKKIEIEDISTIEKVDAKLDFSEIFDKKIEISRIDVKGLEFSENKMDMLLKLGKLSSDKVNSKLEKRTSEENITSEVNKKSEDWSIDVGEINIQSKLFKQEIDIKIGGYEDSKIDFKKFIYFVKNNVIDEKK